MYFSYSYIYTPLKKEYIAWHDCPLTNTNSTSESDSEDENRIRDDEKCCVCKLKVPETSLGQ
jgi:hypothetical protein